MYQIRGEGFWAKCWMDEPFPLPSLAGTRSRLLTTAAAYSTPSDRRITAAIERWQHLGGIAAYAALGVEFEPAETGQLAIHVPDHADGELLEQACFGLTEARLTLARELGPGHLALTHARGHDVDSSPASFATTATALAFVLSRSEEETRAASATLIRRPCQFQMTVVQAARMPESLRKRSGVDGVVLAGPFLKGDLRVGDHVLVADQSSESQGVVLGFPPLNFGSERRNWIAVEVDRIDEFAPEGGTSATGPAHWRPQEES